MLESNMPTQVFGHVQMDGKSDSRELFIYIWAVYTFFLPQSIKSNKGDE